MKNPYNIGDLLTALSESDEMDEIKTRVFLYMLSKICIGNPRGKHTGPTGEGLICISPDMVMHELNITKQEYNEATEFFTSRQLLICTPFEEKDNFWHLGTTSQWLLKKLGPNICKAEDIVPKIISIDGEDNLSEFLKNIEEKIK